MTELVDEMIASEEQRSSTYDEGLAFVVWVGHVGTVHVSEVTAMMSLDKLTEGMTDEELIIGEVGLEILSEQELDLLYYDRSVTLLH